MQPSEAKTYYDNLMAQHDTILRAVRKPAQPIPKREACEAHGRDVDQLTDNCDSCGTTPEAGN